LLSAPYGIYATTDGFIAIAMVDLHRLASALNSKCLEEFDQEDSFSRRDEIKDILSKHLVTQSSSYWLKDLHADDIWAMEVLDWNKMKDHPAYKALQMEQTLIVAGGKQVTTTRCPIRINGERLFSGVPAPSLGENNREIKQELFLKTVS
jgi:crotonobetainyl-CoA:carnitine CoA-transferase CaiB-like acyl-CoA transferase